MDTCAGPSWALPPPQSFSFSKRTTKLFTSLLVFLIYTTFTFAADRKANPEYWRLINGPQTAKDKRETTECDDRDDMCFKPIEMDRIMPDSDSFDDHGNETLAHEHMVAIGIAQDLFYELNEQNWENTRPYDLLVAWSQDTNNLERYQSEKKSRPDLSIISYLPENLIGWKGMHCDVTYDDGCRNMPTQDYILAHLPQERHRARQLKFSLVAIQRYYIQGYTFTKVLQSAKKRLDGHCEEFTRIFFHKATHHKEQTCPEDIANIVVQVIMAIVGLYFIATALVDVAIWTTKAIAEHFLEAMIGQGSTELLTATTRGLPASQMVGEAGAMVPAYGELVVPVVTDTELLVAEGGAQVVYLANSVAASTAELSFDSAETIAQLVKAEAAQAAQAAESGAQGAVEPIPVLKTHPKVSSIKKPLLTPLSELAVAGPSRFGVRNPLYQHVAEALLQLPSGELNGVDLMTRVGSDTLEKMWDAHMLGDQMALTEVKNTLQKIKLTTKEPPAGSGPGSSGSTPYIPQVDGSGSTSGSIIHSNLGRGGIVFNVRTEIPIYDEEDGQFKAMQKEEWVAYRIRHSGSRTESDSEFLDEFNNYYRIEWRIRTLIQQGRWQEAMAMDQWPTLSDEYRKLILQESMPAWHIENVDWSKWSIAQLESALQQPSETPAKNQLPKTPQMLASQHSQEVIPEPDLDEPLQPGDANPDIEELRAALYQLSENPSNLQLPEVPKKPSKTPENYQLPEIPQEPPKDLNILPSQHHSHEVIPEPDLGDPLQPVDANPDYEELESALQQSSDTPAKHQLPEIPKEPSKTPEYYQLPEIPQEPPKDLNILHEDISELDLGEPLQPVGVIPDRTNYIDPDKISLFYPELRPWRVFYTPGIRPALTEENLAEHNLNRDWRKYIVWNLQHRRWDVVFESPYWNLIGRNDRVHLIRATMQDYMEPIMLPFMYPKEYGLSSTREVTLGMVQRKLKKTFPPVPGVHVPGYIMPPSNNAILPYPPHPEMEQEYKEFELSTSGVPKRPPPKPPSGPKYPQPSGEVMKPYTSWSGNVRYHIKKIWQAIKRILGLSKSAKRQLLTIDSGKSYPRTSQTASALQLWSVGGVFRKGQNGPSIQPAVAGFTKMPSEGVPWKPAGQLHAQEDVALQQGANNIQASQLLLGSVLNGGEITAGLLAKRAMEHQNVLGVMARLESFDVDDLAEASGDGTSLYHQIHINSTSFFTTDAARAVADQVMGRNSSLKGDQVVRSTIEFLLVTRGDSEERVNDPEDSAKYLGSRIARRLVRANGSPMTPDEARDFLVKYGSTISTYRNRLAIDDPSFSHTNIDLPPETSRDRDFMIVAGPGETSWLDILGGIDVVGIRSESSHEKGTAELEVRANTNWATRSARNSKRSTRDQDRPIAHALIVHQLGAMRGTIHARFLGGMRWTRKRDVTPPITRDGDMYKVSLRKEYFRNEIKSNKGFCSIDEYTGDQTKNLKNCHEFLNDAVEPVLRKIGYSMTGMDNVDDWESGGMAPFVHLVMEQFPSYDMVKRTAQLQSQHEQLENKLFERLKNSLVAKAWADESCFVKCTPNGRYYKREELHHLDGDVCRAVCYDKTEQRAEGLYGLDAATGFAAESPPWNLNKTEIMAVSRQAYIKHGAGSILPGSINMNPYDAVYEDVAPPLPVCRSELITVSPSNEYHKGASTYPCTCGDKYGNETLAFMKAAPAGWQGHGEKQESRMLETCLKDKRLESLAKSAPAAYLNNMCQIVYGAISPPGVGSFMELRNKGHYKENQNMCLYVTNFVNENKHMGDPYLNDGVCKIWASQAKDFHRNFHIDIGAIFSMGLLSLAFTSDKHKKDFSDINSKLNKGACKRYRDWWDDDCDDGKNWKTCGVPCPDYGFGSCQQ